MLPPEVANETFCTPPARAHTRTHILCTITDIHIQMQLNSDLSSDLMKGKTKLTGDQVKKNASK